MDPTYDSHLAAFERMEKGNYWCPFLCEDAVKYDGMLLQFFLHGWHTEKLCKIAVRQNGLALKYVPDRLKTRDVCSAAVYGKYNSDDADEILKFVPEDMRDDVKFYMIHTSVPPMLTGPVVMPSLPMKSKRKTRR
jgi:hypothetical protein